MNLNHGVGDNSFSKENIVYFSNNYLVELDYFIIIDSQGIVSNR